VPQKNIYRTERVNELIRRKLILLLKQETKDPRLKQVVITDVVVSRDLTSAKVFFSVDVGSVKIIATSLNKASGFFRSSLSKTLDLRHTPTLSFIYDSAPNTGAKIDNLLSKL